MVSRSILLLLVVHVLLGALVTTSGALSFSAGFSSDAVLQRSTGSQGARVYGFTDAAAAVVVTVDGVDGAGKAVKYQVCVSHPWVFDTVARFESAGLTVELLHRPPGRCICFSVDWG
jgi:hypothetical protein